MEAGWIKIYRKIKDSSSYSRGLEYLGAMVWLVLNARHEDGWKDGREVKRGQLLVSRQQLAKIWKVSEQTTRTILDNLEADQFFTRESTKRGSIITICNYDIYQANENTINQESTNRSTNDFFEINQQSTNGNSNLTNSSSIGCNKTETATNQQTNQEPTTNKNERNNNHNACARIREKLAPAVDALFGDWLRMYSTVHNHDRELSEQAEASNLRKFMNLPEAQQIASLEWSIQRETKSVAIIDPEQAAAPAADAAAPVDEWELMKAAARSAGKGVSA